MKIIRIQLLITLIVLLSACEKLVEIDPPQDFLIATTVFDSDETAISATTGLYATMMKIDFILSYNIAFYTGLYSDELDYNQSVLNLVSVYRNNIIPQDAPTNAFWNNGYHYIYQANSLIEGLTKSTKISHEVRNQLLGEAKFIRAFWNYYLTILYGPLPLVTTTDYKVNASLARSSVDIIQNYIIQDLIESKKLLSENYVAANSKVESSERIRPNTFVASALLARIYLQRKDYVNAEKESSRIISDSKYDLSDIGTVFKRTSREVIWQMELPSATATNNSYEGNYFPLTAKPNVSSNIRSSTISADLLSLFGQKDKRRSVWVGTFSDNTVVPAIRYNFSSKYKTITAPADEYSTPFRLAEMYLIRAEARAKLGLISDAMNDTDEVRSRAGLDLLHDITPDISTIALLDSIGNERRRELFCEWGIRWFDIRRSDNADEIMKRIAARKGANWRTTALLWPIPLNEVLNSANNLKQNDGYN